MSDLAAVYLRVNVIPTAGKTSPLTVRLDKSIVVKWDVQQYNTQTKSTVSSAAVHKTFDWLIRVSRSYSPMKHDGKETKSSINTKYGEQQMMWSQSSRDMDELHYLQGPFSRTENLIADT